MQEAEACVSGIAGCDAGRFVTTIPVTVISVRSGKERVLLLVWKVGDQNTKWFLFWG